MVLLLLRKVVMERGRHLDIIPLIKRGEVSVFTVPSETPETDGPFEWKSTTVIIVEVRAGGHTGLGYTD